MWLTKLETRRKNHEKWFVLDRGFNFVSDNCWSSVMILLRTVSHLLTWIIGEGRGGLVGRGSEGLVNLVWKELLSVILFSC